MAKQKAWPACGDFSPQTDDRLNVCHQDQLRWPSGPLKSFDYVKVLRLSGQTVPTSAGDGEDPFISFISVCRWNFRSRPGMEVKHLQNTLRPSAETSG